MTHRNDGLEDMHIEDVKTELRKYRSSKDMNLNSKSDEELRSLLGILRATYERFSQEYEEDI